MLIERQPCGAAPEPQVLRDDTREFDQLIEAIRPKLHRYCARMTGSVVDAEDVVQDALAKAFHQLSTTTVSNLEGWLFRIAHNKSIDYLRKAKSHATEALDDHPHIAALAPPLESKELATWAFSMYLQLTLTQRSCVILKDVIGYSLAEISEILELSVGATKAALHRGRENLRRLAEAPDAHVPRELDEPQASLLSAYVECFNARDFDAVRAMLADDVRLDLVERLKARGATDVGKHFQNYNRLEDWRLSLGFVEGRAVILVSEATDPTSFVYFISVHWNQDEISFIRDYRYARYAMTGAEISAASA